MFERILIANRGEVATRVARTCRRLGLETVAVFTADEAGALHVEACDEGVLIGEEPSAHLDVEKIARAARASGVQAVHPGYGLERDEVALARALEEVGIVLIGPPAAKIEALADRMAVRDLAAALGVRVLPGSEQAFVDPNDALAEVDRLGYPVTLHERLGFAGSLPVSVASDAYELSEAIRELGPLDRVGGAFLATWVERARYVEVQLVATADDVLVVGDLELSLRRGPRPLIAESPARAIDQLRHGAALRGAMWDAASEIVRATGCAGLVSCRFAIDGDGTFFFVGLALGLRVEHPVVEMCCGLDLVELAVRVAAGEAMPPEAMRAEPSGCAFSARIDAATDPRTGQPFDARVEAARWPPAPQGKVRIETGVKAGSYVCASHDPLLASVTTYAPTRHDALLMLDRILSETHLAPVVTNVRLLRKALNHESVRAGQYDEGLIDRI
jgi:acetyl/propionyl-CoA carboxylase alpha subunit